MAVQITEEQVRQAEVRAEEAERERAVAARKLEASPYSDVAAMEHSEAARTAAQLRANAREIRAAYELQLEEERRRVSRPELEKAAAAEIRAAGREMEGLEKGLIGAVAQAEAALVALLDASVTYNAGVVRHTQALAGAGLDRRGGESGGEETSLGEYLLRVKGREFRRMDPGSVAGWLLRRVAEGRLGQFHYLVGALFPAHVTAEDQAEWLMEKASKGQ